VQNNNKLFVESMEGAAVAYVAAQLNINAIQIRSISNRVEKRNRNNWKIALAVENLNITLFNFLMSI
jgi:futalosine hydrolase